MATRTAPMGPANGMPESETAAEVPIMASTSGSFSLSAEIDEVDDLDLVAEALGKQRAERAVDEAAGQRLLLVGPALPLEEASGDASARVGPLAIFDGEGEEVAAPPSGDREATTVESTMVPPQRTTTAPSACLATLPVSIEMALPLSFVCTE